MQLHMYDLDGCSRAVFSSQDEAADSAASVISFFAACFASWTENPGKTTFQVPLAARTRCTWCCIRSCSLGTLASFARLPMRETVVRSRVNVGDMAKVSVGAGEFCSGGVMKKI